MLAAWWQGSAIDSTVNPVTNAKLGLDNRDSVD